MPRKRHPDPSFGYSLSYLAHISASQNFTLPPHSEGYFCSKGTSSIKNGYGQELIRKRKFSNSKILDKRINPPESHEIACHRTLTHAIARTPPKKDVSLQRISKPKESSLTYWVNTQISKQVNILPGSNGDTACDASTALRIGLEQSRYQVNPNLTPTSAQVVPHKKT